MSWNDIKSLVYNACGPLLEPYGYKFIKSRSSYEKPTPTGRLVVYIQLTATDQGNYFAKIAYGIRNNLIENIVNKTSTVDKLSQSSTTTILASSGRLWPLNTGEEQAATIAGFQAYIRDTALPFLGKEYSFRDLSTMLNSAAPDKDCEFHPSIWRCHRGLTAAKLAGDPRYEDLKKQYSAYLRTLNNGFYFPEFERCLKNIEDPLGLVPREHQHLLVNPAPPAS